MVETRRASFKDLIARLKIEQKRGLSLLPSFDKNSISIRGTNATAGEKRKRCNKGLEEKENVTTCVEEKEWNYTRGFTMSRGTSVSSLFTSILLPSPYYPRRNVHQRVSTRSEFMQRSWLRYPRLSVTQAHENVYAYAAIIVYPARIPSSPRSRPSNILPCKSNYALVSNA